ncbi:MAG: ATP synthase subunit b [Candidatus Jorgensenbacteria bacterium GW2011_GWA1_48_13]|uniref:ATP synthase subunit b n=2 Tax=Candidatus Joergenseniibacteriota TaxID=1752739 RepID=A0A0G1W8G2_9BACT|nr:MAG: ATP synthase subunit b [Candidatus Jorgensenbacteria bacterium GW2011_GWA1_48_13]KKU99315.1 MAG: F0F1 ATP synthase subunit B, F-type H+-transporting ATPase subunit b [Candidatus Jorgensenbacteria bacterium GW2011_GWC1_48_8]KKW14998.1 MAG: ATP synthase subunit b [Candidatus Jorgensenbacteria bacterium GW2011_GWB1_50_10]
MSELFHNLGIDWKVLLAQIVNFAILLFVLKKFAYKPILKVLNDRRKKIEEAIERSKGVDEKMAEIEALKEKILVEARRESSEIIKKAEEAADKIQEDALKEAYGKSEKFMAESLKKVQAEREKIFQEVKNETAGLVYAAVERTIGDLADEKLKAKMVEDALKFVISKR